MNIPMSFPSALRLVALSCGPLMLVALSGFSTCAASEQTEYGKYLVEEVARCQMCHSPVLENGELDKTKWLKGATLDFQPIKPMEKWHKTAPDLTPSGRLWERWKEDGLRKFLETAHNPRGGTADPPMPAYKFKKADADAIVEYLKTLK
jgi:hypothetical protein